MAADGEDDPPSGTRELERDLLAARAGAHDQDAAVRQGARVAVAARVELGEPRRRRGGLSRQAGIGRVTRRDDHVRGQPGRRDR